ncbi:Hypothetical predicted protein, partial [Paramuricea clavata]
MKKFLEDRFTGHTLTELKNLWHEDVTHEESKSLKKWESKQIWLEKYEAEFKHESFLKPPRKYNESKPTGDSQQQDRRGMTDNTHLQSISKQLSHRRMNPKQFQNNRRDERKSANLPTIDPDTTTTSHQEISSREITLPSQGTTTTTEHDQPPLTEPKIINISSRDLT